MSSISPLSRLLRLGAAALGGTLVVAFVFLLLNHESEPSTPTALATNTPPVDLNALTQDAERGTATAQFRLGDAYLRGQGTRAQPKLAAEWLLKAAAQGHAEAQYTLGMMAEAGQGVPSDLSQAREWFRQAAEQEHRLAQYSLAVLYASGRGGPRNDPEAIRWLQRSAQNGEGLAQFALAYRCMDGQGVPRDLPEAYKWLALAVDRQIPDAKTSLDELRAKMSRSEVAEGRKRAEQFRPGRK